MAYVWVKPGEKESPSTVVLWEKSAAHPEGAVYIRGGSGPVKVGVTQAVTQRLKAGRLVEVKSPSTGAAAAEVTPTGAAEVSPAGQTSAAVEKGQVLKAAAKKAAGSRVKGQGL